MAKLPDTFEELVAGLPELETGALATAEGGEDETTTTGPEAPPGPVRPDAINAEPAEPAAGVAGVPVDHADMGQPIVERLQLPSGAPVVRPDVIGPGERLPERVEPRKCLTPYQGLYDKEFSHAGGTDLSARPVPLLPPVLETEAPAEGAPGRQEGPGERPEAAPVPGLQPVKKYLTPYQKKRARLKEKHLALIEREDRKIERYANKIAAAALRAPELAEVDLELFYRTRIPPEGWTKRELKVALDADKPMKIAPSYLAFAGRVRESFKRSREEAPAAPVLNAEKVTLQLNQYNYTVKNLDDDDK